MHHGTERDQALERLQAELLQAQQSQVSEGLQVDREAQQGFGATGKFPEGQLVETDEGEIAFGVSSYQGKVVVQFGSPVAWLGMSPKQAMRLAAVLQRRAREITRSSERVHSRRGQGKRRRRGGKGK
jgi:hypothetical protein